MDKKLTDNIKKIAQDEARRQRQAAWAARDEAAADILGKTPRKVNINIDMLRRDGVFIRVHVDGLSKLKRPTTDAERGISGKDVRKRLQTAGMTYTLGREFVSAYHSLENKVRQNLERWSYDVQGFRPDRLLTWAAGAEWLRKHNQLTAELATINQQAIESLERRQIETSETFLKIAAMTWNALSKPDDPMEPVIVDNIAYTQDEAGFNRYSARVIEEALAAIPTANDIRAITISYDVAVAQLGSDVLAELNDLTVQNLRADELEIERRNLNQREYERKYAANEFRRQVAQRIREQLTAQDDPYSEAIKALRNRTAQSAARVLKALEKSGGKMTGPSARAMKNLVETFRVMTMGGDQELLDLINKVETRADAKMTGPGLEETLEKISALYIPDVKAVESEAARKARADAIEFRPAPKARKPRKSTSAATAVEF